MENNYTIIDKFTSNNLINRQENHFLAFRELIESKSYVPLPNVLLNHALTNNKLSDLEKSAYLAIYSLSFINLQDSKPRSIGLSAIKLGKIVGCSKARILAIEKNLSDKGYLSVIKQKNKFGQDNCNLLSPTLPKQVFETLCAMPDRRGLFLPFSAKEETQLTYLERTKQYIPLNYQIFKLVVSSTKLSYKAKILWLAAYSKAHKNIMTSEHHGSEYDGKQYDRDQKDAEISFTSSYIELAAELNCSHGVITSNMNLLVKEGFLNKKRFHVKNGSDLQDRCDKSLWHITITLPAAYKKQIEAIEDRRGYKPKNKKENKKESNEYHASENRVSDNLSINSMIDSINNEQENTNTLISDPDTSLFRPHLIKALKINRKNRSSERADFQDFEKEKNKQQREEKIDICGIQKKATDERQILNESEKNKSESNLDQNNHKISETKKGSNQKNYDKKRKSLAEIEPISEEEAVVLRNLSGRDFSSAYMNKLMQKLAKLHLEHGFFSRKLFLAYMEKVLAKELRETTKANNVDFRFKQEVDVKKREKYLEEIETSFDTSDAVRLKKKIAGAFDSEMAYEILTSIQSSEVIREKLNCEIEEDRQDQVQHDEYHASEHRINENHDSEYRNSENNYDEDYCEEDHNEVNDEYQHPLLAAFTCATPQTFLINLSKDLELLEHQKERLLEQVRSVYGSSITKLEFKKIKSTPTKQEKAESAEQKDEQTLTKEALRDAIPGSAWHKVSQKLIAKYGVHLYKVWLGKNKVEVSCDEAYKTLSLKGSMIIIARYVPQFFPDIYDLCRQEGYQLSQIS